MGHMKMEERPCMVWLFLEVKIEMGLGEVKWVGQVRGMQAYVSS